MANVAAAAAESKTTYNAYKVAGILSLTKKFEIPVFNNMDSSSSSSNWSKVDGKWYYYDPSGGVAKGWRLINNVYYYFDNSGVMQTGWLKYKSRWYYLQSSGAMKTGWLKYKNKWYYLDAKNGDMKASSWLKYKEKWYYLDASGIMLTGWYKYKNQWYYMDATGAAVTGWLKYKNKWYYLESPNCNMLENKWVLYKNDWYYLGSGGAMATGWLDYKNQKYYLTSSGAMAKRIIELNGTTYLFNKNGALETSFESSKAKITVESVTSPSTRQIDLTWTKPDIPNTGYQIMWSTTKDFSSNYLVRTSGVASKLDYSLTTSQSGTTYYVKVRAYRIAYDIDGTRSDVYFPWSETKAISVK